MQLQDSALELSQQAWGHGDGEGQAAWFLLDLERPPFSAGLRCLYHAHAHSMSS